MKDRRKKVFLMSVFSFLIISGIVYIFLILRSLEDIKFRSFFITNNSFIERAFLPVFKYLSLIDDSQLKRLNKDKEAFNFGEEISQLAFNKEDSSNNYKKENLSFSVAKKSNSDDYLPQNKISSQLSNLASGLNSTSNTTSIFKKSISQVKGLDYAANRFLKDNQDKKQKEVEIGNKFNENSKDEGGSNQLMNVKSALISSMKSKSADTVRMEWDRGFSGSVKPTKKLLYKDNLLEIDRVNAEVMDFKNDVYKSLPTGEINAKMDKDSSISSLPDDIKKEIMKNMIKDALNSTINPLYPQDKEKFTNEEPLRLEDIPTEVIDVINEWQWESGQKAIIKKEGELFIVSYKEDPENFQMLVDNRGKVLKIKTICSNGWIDEESYTTCET